jgi:hypothetical protein
MKTTTVLRALRTWCPPQLQHVFPLACTVSAPSKSWHSWNIRILPQTSHTPWRTPSGSSVHLHRLRVHHSQVDADGHSCCSSVELQSFQGTMYMQVLWRVFACVWAWTNTQATSKCFGVCLRVFEYWRTCKCSAWFWAWISIKATSYFSGVCVCVCLHVFQHGQTHRQQASALACVCVCLNIDEHASALWHMLAFDVCRHMQRHAQHSIRTGTCRHTLSSLCLQVHADTWYVLLALNTSQWMQIFTLAPLDAGQQMQDIHSSLDKGQQMQIHPQLLIRADTCRNMPSLGYLHTHAGFICACICIVPIHADAYSHAYSLGTYSCRNLQILGYMRTHSGLQYVHVYA